MSDFYKFASDSPFLTFFLGCLVVSAIASAAQFRLITIKRCKCASQAPGPVPGKEST